MEGMIFSNHSRRKRLQYRTELNSEFNKERRPFLAKEKSVGYIKKSKMLIINTLNTRWNVCVRNSYQTSVN